MTAPIPGGSAASDAATAAAAQAVPPTVQIYGPPDSFGDMPAGLASGQNVQTNGVQGWEFAPGRMAWQTARAADGTILMGGLDHNLSLIYHTGDETAIASFDPGTNSYANILLKTSCNLVDSPTCVRKTSVAGPTGLPGGVEIADVQAIDGGNAIAFTTWSINIQDIADDGVWPAFGILTEGPDGWRVAEGSTWMNQWTGAELNRSNPTSDQDEQACPMGDSLMRTDQSECLAVNEMSLLPQSQDLVIAQYFGGEGKSAVTILDVTGPDAAGRFSTVVKASEILPPIPDYTTPDPSDHLDLQPLATATDPSSTPGDERFAVWFDIHNALGKYRPGPVIEYSYDASTGDVTPVSAPILPPDGLTGRGDFVDWAGITYDHNGTLWMGRNLGWCPFALCDAGKMAVFPKVDGQRRTESSAACRYDGGSLADYTSTISGTQVWGTQCKPNYDILQPQHLFASLLMEDPPNGVVAVEALSGRIFAIRSSGSGTNMTFQVANPVDTSLELLPNVDLLQPALGAVDPQHRLWFPVGQVTDLQASGDDCFPVVPGGPPVDCKKAPRQIVDQWLYSVDLDDLYEPPAMTIGDFTPIQAEQSQTITTQQRTGTTADVEVDSDAYYGPCNAECADDFWFPGAGFDVRDDSDFPHLQTTLQYKVDVPTAGNYTIWYRAATLPDTPSSTIRAQIGSTTVDTNVSTPEGGWINKQSAPVFLPAGTYDISLSVPPGASGWYLSWMYFQRE